MSDNETDVSLLWTQGLIPLSDLDSEYLHLDESGFYALYGGKVNQSDNRFDEAELLYIGQAYNQSIRERVKQEHPAYDCIKQYLRMNNGHQLLMKAGVIQRCTQKNVTEQLFDDIEACLIQENQPMCNRQNKQHYQGRSIRIQNRHSEGLLTYLCVYR